MKQAQMLPKLIENAKAGGFALKKLNFAMGLAIPFNKRHSFKVKEVGEDYIRTFAPYRRKNWNHLKGMHACAIATITEFAAGLLIGSKIDPSKYRVIMSEMKMEYHYQAKKDIVAECRLSDAEIQTRIIEPLQSSDKIFITLEVKTHDTEGNHISTGHVVWQVKNWSKVKTKVSA